jgi:gamma-glutamyltranspeptidase/glutathione hydrolase
MALLRSASVSGAGLPALPASTSLIVIDPQGMAVGCAMTMDNLFGTGRIAPGTGILLAASPAAAPLPLLAAAIAWSPKDGLRAVAASSGQQAASIATAQAIDAALHRVDPTIAEPGRANLISCTGGLPGAPDSCRWRADPRGGGVALGGTARGGTARAEPGSGS